MGDHLGTRAAGDRVVLHFFACCHRGYPGWRWAVTVVRAARAKTATVSECALLPGEEALLAPDWVPWRDRLRPGDLGVGDLLPVGADDERLAALVLIAGDDAVVDWYADTAADTAESVVDGRLAQFLPGRVRVLSATGRDDAAQRWHAGDHGPYAPLARAAPAGCASCGFFVSLSGALGQLFGVCANAYAPDDGRVVAADHGCGAHSEAVRADQNGGLATPVIDEFGYDLVDLPGVSVEETVFEPFSPGT